MTVGDTTTDSVIWFPGEAVGHNPGGEETAPPSDVLTSSWTAFDAEWKSIGDTQPDIGNGSLTAKYLSIPAGVTDGQQSWTVDFFIQLSVGSTTTFGDGGWQFSPPPFATDPTPFALGVAGSAIAIESDGTIHCGMGVSAGNDINLIGPDGETRMDDTHPFEWDANSILMVTGRYLGVAD